MTNDLSAEEVRALLKLEPHATCGFVRVTFISNQRIAPGGLPAPFLTAGQRAPPSISWLHRMRPYDSIAFALVPWREHRMARRRKTGRRSQ